MEERLGGKQDDEAKRNELAEHFGNDLLFADILIMLSLAFLWASVVELKLYMMQKKWQEH